MSHSLCDAEWVPYGIANQPSLTASSTDAKYTIPNDTLQPSTQSTSSLAEHSILSSRGQHQVRPDTTMTSGNASWLSRSYCPQEAPWQPVPSYQGPSEAMAHKNSPYNLQNIATHGNTALKNGLSQDVSAEWDPETTFDVMKYPFGTSDPLSKSYLHGDLSVHQLAWGSAALEEGKFGTPCESLSSAFSQPECPTNNQYPLPQQCRTNNDQQFLEDFQLQLHNPLSAAAMPCYSKQIARQEVWKPLTDQQLAINKAANGSSADTATVTQEHPCQSNPVQADVNHVNTSFAQLSTPLGFKFDICSRFRSLPGSAEEKSSWDRNFDDKDPWRKMGLEFKKEIHTVLQYNNVAWTKWVSMNGRSQRLTNLMDRIHVKSKTKGTIINVEDPKSVSNIKVCLTKETRRHSGLDKSALVLWISFTDQQGKQLTERAWSPWDPLFATDRIQLPDKNNCLQKTLEQTLWDQSARSLKEDHRRQVRDMLSIHIAEEMIKEDPRFDVDTWRRTKIGSSKLPGVARRLVEGVSQTIEAHNAMAAHAALSWDNISYKCEVGSGGIRHTSSRTRSKALTLVIVKATPIHDPSNTVHQTVLTLTERDCSLGIPFLRTAEGEEQVEDEQEQEG